MSRLTARFWVDAYLTRLRLMDIPAFVVRHGDDTAGTIMVKLNTLDGKACLYQRAYDMMEDSHHWSAVLTDTDAQVDEAIVRQQGFDPDLWVVEVEDRQGRHLLDAPGFA